MIYADPYFNAEKNIVKRFIYPTLLLNLTALQQFFYNQNIEWKGEIMKKILLGVFVALALGACGQVYDREPVGVGYDNDELKLSPCACILVYQA